MIWGRRRSAARRAGRLTSLGPPARRAPPGLFYAWRRWEGTRTFARTTTRSMHFLSSARCSTSWCRQRSPTSFASRSCQETMCRRTSWSATTAAIRGRPHERQRRPALRHHRRRRRLVPASPASAASRLIHIADELNIAVTVRYCVEYAQALCLKKGLPYCLGIIMGARNKLLCQEPFLPLCL